MSRISKAIRTESALVVVRGLEEVDREKLLMVMGFMGR